LQHRGHPFDAGFPGHHDVHHDHVRLRLQRLEDGALGVLGLAHHLDVGLRLEDALQA
jgi:hypothetical protein